MNGSRWEHEKERKKKKVGGVNRKGKGRLTY